MWTFGGLVGRCQIMVECSGIEVAVTIGRVAQESWLAGAAGWPGDGGGH